MHKGAYCRRHGYQAVRGAHRVCQTRWQVACTGGMHTTPGHTRAHLAHVALLGLTMCLPLFLVHCATALACRIHCSGPAPWVCTVVLTNECTATLLLLYCSAAAVLPQPYDARRTALVTKERRREARFGDVFGN